MPDWPPALTACPRCGTTVAIPIHPGDVIPTPPRRRPRRLAARHPTRPPRLQGDPMTEPTGYADLDHWIDQPEPHEDTDGYLIGWRGSHDSADWTPTEETP